MSWRRPGRGRWVGAVATAGVTIALCGGCIGTISREDFNGTIQERGGGFTSELPLEAVAAVADELRADDVELRRMTVTPESEIVTLEVRDPSVPENLDRYQVSAGTIDSVEPIRLTADDNLDREVFAASGPALDRIEPMVDTALAEFGQAGGYVSSMTVDRGGGGEVVFQLALESPRTGGSAQFTADGELIGVSRR